MGKTTRKKLPAVYQPLGFALGWAGGALAGFLFRRTWRLIRHEDDAPDALDPDRGWGEVLVAAAVQGAIFASVKSAVNRGGAKAIQRSTGSWPVKTDRRPA
ncbi:MULTISPECIES: DUF4235 domain-containing protein [unclassified Streptomyces]|uniref:DUF4235 domain-containing protein n=1 Tax=unclassified Streptomyces TaxID=2593676 RepID=UPI00190616FB|nr:DUF4235 domain-containing protein [Streptomyces sp. HSG2]